MTAKRGVPARSPRRRNGPTLAEIAKQLGVSTVAVGLALNGRPGVGEELRAAAHKLARELGYRPNYAARALRTVRSQMMGVIYRNLHNSAFSSLIEGFDEVCNSRGYHVMLGSSRLDPEREISLIESFAGREIDGLAIVALDENAAEEAWRRTGDRPLAFLSSSVVPTAPKTFAVRAEETAAVVRSVEHLAALGHRRIALMTGTQRFPTGPQREQTFRAVAGEHDVEPLLVAAGWDLEEARQELARTLSAPADRRPTAVIANSDRLALAVYLATRDVGLDVPGDVSVIGHDDTEFAQALGPPLTTFSTDHRQIGVRAAEQLIDIAEGGAVTQRHTVVPVTLVVRGSTAPPRR
ncbi:LacI family DNA-binding transcriptional regulator [Micromonospora echinospora]|uniref:LacI family DNA-binding transcriptional regulator n=1 Tax=Micromonospora echinospora TaxID=1877 RepID=UPI00379DB676